MSSDNSGFGGIFNKIGKLVFTEEYIQSKEDSNPVTKPSETTVMPTNTTTANTAVNNASTINTSNITPKQDMVDKVHALVNSINKPGIDFLELWNATEAMGAINETNVFNAFVALKIASGNTLTKQVVISTGESYCSELQAALESDISEKIKIKTKLTDSKNANRNSLSNEITDLNNKIVELQNLLKEKNAKLQNIDADFDPKLLEIDEKIANGKAAVDTVMNEIRNVLNIANKAIKE
jgi:hypothetical protein